MEGKRKWELLAPAGSYESMTAAFAAGADAVYIGGSRFGARAYAENLDREMLCRAIDYAHLHGRRLYMTVNTLFKEQELKELPDYPTDFFVNKKSKTNLENSPKMLEAAIETLEQLPVWELEVIHEAMINLAQKLEVKNGTLLWPVRIAAAGTLVTPGGAMEILTLLGREEALDRLRAGLSKLA